MATGAGILELGKKSSDADDRFPLAGKGYGLREPAWLPCDLVALNLPVGIADRLRLAGEQLLGPRRS